MPAGRVLVWSEADRENFACTGFVEIDLRGELREVVSPRARLEEPRGPLQRSVGAGCLVQPRVPLTDARAGRRGLVFRSAQSMLPIRWAFDRSCADALQGKGSVHAEWAIGRPEEGWTLKRLLLSRHQRGEGSTTKRDLEIEKDEQKKELARDIAAMANAAGGDLVFGVEEAKSPDGKTNLGYPAKMLAA